MKTCYICKKEIKSGVIADKECIDNLLRENKELKSEAKGLKSRVDRLEKLLDDKCGRCIANEREKAAREFAAKTQEALKFYKSHCGEGSIYYSMREEINEIVKEFEKENKRWNVLIAEVEK